MLKKCKQRFFLLCAVLLLFVLIPLIGCERNGNRPGKVTDVVIVGGGVAGLSAAADLSSRYNVVVLEKENRLGGRILTKEWQGIRYELGADSIASVVLPPELALKEKSNIPVGFVRNGTWFLESSLWKSLRKYPFIQNDLPLIHRIAVKESIDFSRLSEESRLILTSFFRTINAGSIHEFSSRYRWLAVKTMHFPIVRGGNNRYIDFLRSSVSGKIITGATVTAVVDEHEFVRIDYMHHGQHKTMRARSAVVATTASVAKKLLKNVSHISSRFLSAIRYNSGAIIVIGVQGTVSPLFRYVATPGYPFDCLSMRRHRQFTVISAYYFTGNVHNLSLRRLKASTAIQLVKMGLIASEKDIVFSDGMFWKETEPVISDEVIHSFSPDALRPSKRVFLAGDYTFINDQWPYGVPIAAFSGKRAAQLVRSFLETSQ